jgi:hypothetical protein
MYVEKNGKLPSHTFAGFRVFGQPERKTLFNYPGIKNKSQEKSLQIKNFYPHSPGLVFTLHFQ